MIGKRIRRQVALEAYSDRNETLRLLGFKSYSAYIKSRLWKIIRERAFQILGDTCVRKCGRTATQIHHASYTREVLMGEDLRGLIPICSGCHKAASLTTRRTFKKDGNRVRSLAETNSLIAKPFGKWKKRNPREHYCRCGNMRRKKKKLCKACKGSPGVPRPYDGPHGLLYEPPARPRLAK